MEIQSQQQPRAASDLQPPFSRNHSLLSYLDSKSNYLPPNHTAVPFTTTVPTTSLTSYLSTEILLPHLTPLYDYLKYASQPSAIRPLHQRRADEHEILIDERPDWHLVCWQNGLCLKPLPPFLLDYDFFTAHIAANPELHSAAYGFLLTWTDLIKHQSDYRIAQDLGLVPEKIPWTAFAAFLADLRHHREGGSSHVHPRYEYGELWLKELCVLGWWVNGWEARYYHLFSDYVSFGLANYAQLLAAFAVIGLVLSALQVGLATEQGLPPGWFADMSWGLALVSCLVAAGSAVAFVLFFGVYYIRNMRVALKYDRNVRKEGGSGGKRWEGVNEKVGIA